MRQISQHHLAESLLKARSVQDLLYFPGYRGSCSNLLEARWENLGPAGTARCCSTHLLGPCHAASIGFCISHHP